MKNYIIQFLPPEICSGGIFTRNVRQKINIFNARQEKKRYNKKE